MNLPIDLIAHLGRHHNCWFVSIKALESILAQERELRGVPIATILLDEKNVFEAETKRRVLEVVRHLESLYEDLNMKDLAFAVRRSYAQSKTSKIGTHHGDVRLYSGSARDLRSCDSRCFLFVFG